MKTDNQSISDVLAKNATSFFIPPFQRSYAWGRPEIERYFDDIKRIIASELDIAERDKLEHFFGTLVIKQESTVLAQKTIIVDGQQRLTTTLIFLIALRDLESTIPENKEYITQTYLTNPSSSFEDKIKLKQVTKDWDAYKALVNNDVIDNGVIKNAYELLSKLIVNFNNDNKNVIFEHYITAIRRLNVAIILLDERSFKGEDPQIIFETLNSLGKPLTLADLVRNFVLLNMESEELSKIYEEIWYPKIEAILGDNTSNFFRDYLQYKTARSIKVVSNNNTKEIYQLFKDFVSKNFNARKDFVTDIVRFVHWYKWIITEKVTDSVAINADNNQIIKELVRNIFHDIEAEAFKPFVLGLFEYNQHGVNGLKMNDELFISILEAIRTYLIRRRTIGLAQGENKNIVLLCNKIAELIRGDKSMFDFFSNMFYRMRMPNDDEMRKELSNLNFYELKKYSKFILGKIEENNAKVSVSFRNTEVTIEHIMPQTLNATWQSELGDDYNNVHKTYVHNIGNLILTEFNREIGNRAFTSKKTKLSESSLYFRLDVISRDKWNKENILEHQTNMINWFLETFPLPSVYQNSNNWSRKNIDSNTISPLDDEASDIAAGEKPEKIIIEKQEYKVSHWTDLFLQFLNYINLHANYGFDIVIDNQEELFGSTIIVKQSELQSMIIENPETSKRYRTFDGKNFNDVKHISVDAYFVYLIASTPTYMKRIANIMNKLYMTEDSVRIILKDRT